MAAPIKDRFDTVPQDLHRVGAHRAPAAKGRGWIGFGYAAIATVVLVFVGLWGLSQINPDVEFQLPNPVVESPAPAPTPEAPAEVEPKLDAEVAITVLNGTDEAGKAKATGDFLEAQGWGGAADGIGTRANSSSDDVETTTIYYNDPAREGAARALVQTLGVGVIELSNTFKASPITVLVGHDLVLPAD